MIRERLSSPTKCVNIAFIYQNKKQKQKNVLSFFFPHNMCQSYEHILDRIIMNNQHVCWRNSSCWRRTRMLTKKQQRIDIDMGGNVYYRYFLPRNMTDTHQGIGNPNITFHAIDSLLSPVAYDLMISPFDVDRFQIAHQIVQTKIVSPPWHMPATTSYENEYHLWNAHNFYSFDICTHISIISWIYLCVTANDDGSMRSVIDRAIFARARDCWRSHCIYIAYTHVLDQFWFVLLRQQIFNTLEHINNILFILDYLLLINWCAMIVWLLDWNISYARWHMENAWINCHYGAHDNGVWWFGLLA